MRRFTTLALITLSAIGSYSCQSYSTGLQRSVTHADATTVVAALHAIAVAQQTYSLGNGGNYGSMVQLREGGYLDVRFDSANGGVKDYSLTIDTKPQSGGVPASFSCTADPTNTGQEAGRHFYIDSTSAAIHVNATQPASAADPVY